MNGAEFSALLLMAVAGTFTPGPNTALSTAIAVNRGWRLAMPFVWAVPVGWMLLFGLCALGVGGLVMAVPAMRWAVLTLSVLYLLWLAWRLAGTSSLARHDDARLNIGFGQGVLLQFLNPKAWMLGLSVMGGWVAGQPDMLLRTLQVMALMFVMGLLSNLCYALLGAMLRNWLSQGRRLCWFNRTMAACLAGTALWMTLQELGR